MPEPHATQQDETPLDPAQVNRWRVGADFAGQRLDNYLIRRLKGVPKSHIYRIVRSGEVRINSKRCDAQDRLNAGDEIRLPPIRVAVSSASTAEPGRAQAAFAHDFLFEDEHLIAVNKPAGLAVHGGSGVSLGLIEQLRMSRPKGVMLELVHRLDRETSGVLIVAKTRRGLLGMQDVFREHDGNQRPDKRYLAVVVGRMANDRQHIKAPLLKYVAPNNERRVRVDPSGQPSYTIVNTLHRDGERNLSLVECELRTGRTHQIRVHLASIGYPIAGDDRYGDFTWNRLAQKDKPALKRMYLHAASLAFVHPVTGESVKFEAPLPRELLSFYAVPVG